LDKCTYCDICRVNCRFDAIDENFVVDPTACEGCNLCYHLCPVQAIEMRDTVAGYWYVSETRYGKMVHGMLEVGEENSGKLVTIIRKQALFLAQTDGRHRLSDNRRPSRDRMSGELDPVGLKIRDHSY